MAAGRAEAARAAGRRSPPGADGRDYTPIQFIPYSTSFASANNFFDCHSEAIDSNVTRSIAPNVRVRAEYSYDDGQSGNYEMVVPVR
jgi:hypothetical protein